MVDITVFTNKTDDEKVTVKAWDYSDKTIGGGLDIIVAGLRVSIHYFDARDFSVLIANLVKECRRQWRVDPLASKDISSVDLRGQTISSLQSVIESAKQAITDLEK